MLEYLFANKNVEKVLMYLYLHGKANATELSRSFDSSLDPTQKTMRKLEEGGLLVVFSKEELAYSNGILAIPFLKKSELLRKKPTAFFRLVFRIDTSP